MLYRAKRVGRPQIAPFVWTDDRPQPEGELLAIEEGLPPEPPPVEEPAPPPQVSLAEIEREAFVQGYAQGERAGFEAGNQRVDATLRRFANTLEEVTGLRRAILAQTEQEMVQLALSIARRIVHREINIDRDLVVTIARVALDRLGSTAATIRLHPDDHAAVAAVHGPAWAGAAVQIVADDTINRGGCKVESECGFIDAGIDAQFDQIASELIGTRDPLGLEHVGAAEALL